MDRDIVIGLTKPWKKTKPESYKAVNRKRVAMELKQYVTENDETLKLKGFFGLQSAEIKLESLMTSDIELGATLIEKKDYRGLLVKTFKNLTDDLTDWSPPKNVQLDDANALSEDKLSKYWPEQILNSAVVRNEDIDRDQILNLVGDDNLKLKLKHMSKSDMKTLLISERILKPGQFRKTYEKAKLFEIIEAATAMCRTELLASVGNFVNNLENPSKRKAINTCVVTFNVTAEVRGYASRGACASCIIGINDSESFNRVWLSIKATGGKTNKTSLTIGVCIEVMVQPKELVKMISRMVGHAGEIEPSKEDIDEVSDEMWGKLAEGDMIELMSSEENLTAANYTDILPLMAVAGTAPHEADLSQVNSMWNYLIDIMVRKVGLSCELIGKPELDNHLMEAMAATISLGAYLQSQEDKSDFFTGALLWLRMADGDNKTTDVRSPAYISRISQVKLKKWSDKVGLAGQAILASMAFKGETGVDTVGYRYLPIYMMINGFTTGVYSVKVLSLGALVSSMLTYAVDRKKEDEQMRIVLKDLGVTFSNEWSKRLGMSPAITWKVDCTSSLIESQIGSILMTEKGARLSYKEAVRAAALILTESRDPAMMTFIAERNAVHVDNMRMAMLDRLSSLSLLDQQQTSKLVSTMMSVVKSAEHTNSVLLRDDHSYPEVDKMVQRILDKRRMNREKDIKYREETVSTLVATDLSDVATSAMIADSTTRGAAMARSVLRVKGDKKTIDMLNDMYGESSSVHEPVLSYTVANAGLKGSMETLLSTYTVTDPRRVIMGADLSVGGDSVFSCAAAVRDDSRGPKHFKESRSLTLKIVEGLEFSTATMFELDADKVRDSIKKIVSKANAISSSVSIKDITHEDIQEVDVELQHLSETVEGSRSKAAKEIVKKIENVLPEGVEVSASNVVGESGRGIVKTIMLTIERRLAKIFRTVKFIEIKLLLASPVIMLDGLSITALMVLKIADKIWDVVATALNKMLGSNDESDEAEEEVRKSKIVKIFKKTLKLGLVTVGGITLMCLLSFRSSVTKTTKLMLKVCDRTADWLASILSPAVETVDKHLIMTIRQAQMTDNRSVLSKLMMKTHLKELQMNDDEEGGSDISTEEERDETASRRKQMLDKLRYGVKNKLLLIAEVSQLLLRCATTVCAKTRMATKKAASATKSLFTKMSKGAKKMSGVVMAYKPGESSSKTCRNKKKTVNANCASQKSRRVNTGLSLRNKVAYWADSAKNMAASWIASSVMGGEVKITKKPRADDNVKKITRNSCKLDELRLWSFEERGQMEAAVLARMVGCDGGELAFSMLGSERAVRSLHEGAEMVAEKTVRVHSSTCQSGRSGKVLGDLSVCVVSCNGCELLNIKHEGGRNPGRTTTKQTGMRLASGSADGSGWLVSEMQSHDERGRVVFGWATKINLDGQDDKIKIVSAAHLVSYGCRNSIELSGDGLACIATSHLTKDRVSGLHIRLDDTGEIANSASGEMRDDNLVIFKDLIDAFQLEGSSDNFALYELAKKDYRGLSGGPISIRGTDSIAIILSQIEGREVEQIDGRKRRIVVGAINMNTRKQLAAAEDLTVEDCEACLQKLRVEREKKKQNDVCRKRRSSNTYKDGEETEWESADDASKASASTKRTRLYSDSEDDEDIEYTETEPDCGGENGVEHMLSRTISSIKDRLWDWMSGNTCKDSNMSAKCAGSGRNRGFMVRARTPFEQMSVLADMREMADEFKLGNGCKAVIESLMKAIAADKVLVIMCIDAATRTVVSALLSVLEIEFRVADSLVALAEMLKAASRSSRRIVINTDVKITLSQEMGFGKPLIIEASKVALVLGIGVRQLGSNDLVKLLTLSCAMISENFELTLFDEDCRDDTEYYEQDPDSEMVKCEISDLMLIGCYRNEQSDVTEALAEDEIRAGGGRPGYITIITDTYDTEKQDEICELICRRMRCRRDRTTVMSVACLAGEIAGKWLDQADLVAVVTTGETISDEYRRTSILPLTATSQDMRRCFRDVLRLYEAKTGSNGRKWSVNRSAANKIVRLSSSIATAEGCNYGVQYFKREQRKQQFKVNTATKLLVACSIEGNRLVDKETLEETVDSVCRLPSGTSVQMSRCKHGIIRGESERYAIELDDMRSLLERGVTKIKTRTSLVIAKLASRFKAAVSKMKARAVSKKKKVINWVSSKIPERMLRMMKWVKVCLTRRNAAMRKTRGGRSRRKANKLDERLKLENRFDPLISNWVKEAEASRGMTLDEDVGEGITQESHGKAQQRPEKLVEKLKEVRKVTAERLDKKNSSKKKDRKKKKLTSVLSTLASKTARGAYNYLYRVITSVEETIVGAMTKSVKIAESVGDVFKKISGNVAAAVKMFIKKLSSFRKKASSEKTASYGGLDRDEESSAKRWSKTIIKLAVVASWLEIDSLGESKRSVEEAIAGKIAGVIGIAAAQSALTKITRLVSDSAARLVSELSDLMVVVAVVVDVLCRMTDCEMLISAGLLKFKLGSGGMEVFGKLVKRIATETGKFIRTDVNAAEAVRGMVSVNYMGRPNVTKRKLIVVRKTSSLVRKFYDENAELEMNDVTQGGQILVKLYTWLRRRLFSWKIRTVLKKIWSMIGSRAEFKGPTGVVKLSRCHSSPKQMTVAAAAGALVVGVGLLAREIAGTDAAVVGALAERKHTADNINNFMKHAVVYARVTRLMTAAMCAITMCKSEGAVKLMAAAAGGALALEWAFAEKDEVGVWYGIIDVLSRAIACGMSKRLITTTLAAWWCDPSDGSLAVSAILLTSSRDRRDVSAPENFERADIIRLTTVRNEEKEANADERKMIEKVAKINNKEIKVIGKLFERNQSLKVCLRQSLEIMKGAKGIEEVRQIEEMEEQGKLDLSAGSEMVDFWSVAGRTAVAVPEEAASRSSGVREEEREMKQLNEIFCKQCRYVGRMDVSRRTELDLSKPDETSRQQSAVFWSEELWEDVIDVEERSEWKAAGDGRMDVLLAIAERNDKQPVFPASERVMADYCKNLYRWIEDNLVSKIGAIEMRLSGPDWGVTINTVNRKATSGILTRARTGSTIAASYLPRHTVNVLGARLANIASRMHVTTKVVNVFAKRRIEKAKQGNVVDRKYVITRTIQAHETDLKLAVSDFFCVLDKMFKLTRRRTGIMVGMSMFREFAQDDWTTRIRSARVARDCGAVMVRVAIDHSSYDANQRLWAIEAVKEIRKMIINKCVVSRLRKHAMVNMLEAIYEELRLKWLITASGDMFLVSGQQMSGHATTSSDNSLRALGYALECASLVGEKGVVEIIKESIRVQGDDTKFDVMITSSEAMNSEEIVAASIKDAMRLMGQDVKQEKTEIRSCTDSCKFLSHYSERKAMIVTKVVNKITRRFLITVEVPMRSREEIVAMIASSLQTGTKRKTRKEAQLLAAKAASFLVMYCGDAAVSNMAAVVLRVANAILTTFDQGKVKKLTVPLDKLPWLVRQAPITGEFSIDIRDILGMHNIGDASLNYIPEAWIVDKSKGTIKALEASRTFIRNAVKELRALKLEKDRELMVHEKRINRLLNSEHDELKIADIQKLVEINDTLPVLSITEDSVGYKPMNDLAEKIKKTKTYCKRGMDLTAEVIKLSDEHECARGGEKLERLRREWELFGADGENTSELREISSKEGIKMALTGAKLIKSDGRQLITVINHEEMMAAMDSSKSVSNIIKPRSVLNLCMSRMKMDKRSILNFINKRDKIVPIEMLAAIEIKGSASQIRAMRDEIVEEVERKDLCVKKAIFDLIETQARNYVEIY